MDECLIVSNHLFLRDFTDPESAHSGHGCLFSKVPEFTKEDGVGFLGLLTGVNSNSFIWDPDFDLHSICSILFTGWRCLIIDRRLYHCA